MKNNKEAAHTPKDLLHEMQALVLEAEAMMSDSVSAHSADALQSMRDKFVATQERFTELYDNARTKVVATAKQTDATIRNNPYQSIAIALGVGLLVGAIAGRRHS